MQGPELWERYKRYLCNAPSISLQLDISRMRFDEAFLESIAGPMEQALDAMGRLERGEKANVDEDRMVGHYWLRAPELAPDQSIRSDIEETVAAVKQFARDIHDGAITPERGDAFYVVLVIGIGGSSLGPQLLADALGTVEDPMIIRFLDNTDPDGIHRVIAELDETLSQTLTVVASKSGRTVETRNTMLEVAEAYRRAGLDFGKHAVAVTCKDSVLHERAKKEKWLGVFPVWDWVGGRTSVTSAVGLLPAALLGLDVDAFLAGARDCDVITRERDPRKNPAALLALMWHYAGGGCGARSMVIMPYKDRLQFFGQYLQQLVMESVGKRCNRDGEVVQQGLTVFGNKGSTDQHAIVQQLRDGRDDFFATFVNVRDYKNSNPITVEEEITTGDYLNASWLGTRNALSESGRESITITLEALDARSLGGLLSLFERAVGLYAELIDVNAYDQPGVEAGKKAAVDILAVQREILSHLERNVGSSFTPDEIAGAIGKSDDVEAVYLLLEHAAANSDHGVKRTPGPDPFSSKYGAK